MTNQWMLVFPAIALASRLRTVVKLWEFPRRNGEQWFLARSVEPGFYAGAGVAIMRGYHVSLLTWLVFDLPVAVWLGLTGRIPALVGEQFLALVAATIANNLTMAHFVTRVAMLTRPREQRAEAGAIQVSMLPRRLRDHTSLLAELAVGVLLIASLALVQRAHEIARQSWAAWNPAPWLRSIDSVLAWLLYLQIGLLLLKVVFVRWRMPLPMKRTEDFRRWRTAWLNYHLKLFDVMRILFALTLLAAIVWLTIGRKATAAFGVGWVFVLLACVVNCQRERRSLEAVTKEVNLLELVREFPRCTVPDGRFLLGFLYIKPGTPSVLVRSGDGIALNLTHPGTYLWAGYLLGLAGLIAWVTR
jgi:hypothetical protein